MGRWSGEGGCSWGNWVTVGVGANEKGLVSEIRKKKGMRPEVARLVYICDYLWVTKYFV